MLRVENFLQANPGKVFFILLVLAIPAFFINLGLLPLFADEPTRANVALEMIINGNYAVPTVGGDFYYNKPPLYNWILAAVYQLGGGYSEFLTRIPAAIPLFLFAITVYFWVNYFLRDKRTAALSGLLMLVNGRMLIYDSMLGHIDIFYSWLTFISFMTIFYFFSKKNWLGLFLVSYFITAVTFLSKGLPSIVFQGFTLIALFYYTKNWRKFFGWEHFLSGVLFLLVTGSYFYNYSLHNPDIGAYLDTIWSQSSQRTAAKYTIWQNLTYIFVFPFEHLGHLFPASLLLLFCFRKGFFTWINQNPFLKYIAIVFIANVWVYWLSPQTRPRYLLMLYPLLFIIWSHAYYTFRKTVPKLNRVFDLTLIVLTILVTISITLSFFIDLSFVPYLHLKIVFLMATGALLSWLIIEIKTHKVIVFAATLLLVRLAFSWLILPHRLMNSEDVVYKKSAIEMGTIAGTEPLYFYKVNLPPEGIPFRDKLIFYIERQRMKTVKFTDKDSMPGYYLTFDAEIKNPKATFVKAYRGNLKLYRVK